MGEILLGLYMNITCDVLIITKIMNDNNSATECVHCSSFRHFFFLIYHKNYIIVNQLYINYNDGEDI